MSNCVSFTARTGNSFNEGSDLRDNWETEMLFTTSVSLVSIDFDLLGYKIRNRGWNNLSHLRLPCLQT